MAAFSVPHRQMNKKATPTLMIRFIMRCRLFMGCLKLTPCPNTKRLVNGFGPVRLLVEWRSAIITRRGLVMLEPNKEDDNVFCL